MKIPLNTSARKRLIVAISAALAIAYLGLAASQLIASRWGSHVELASLERAAWLDPGNADYRHHLGRYFSLVARDPAAAVAQYKAAVELNPHSARYWFDLASAYQVLQDTADQTAALERAILADSMTPDVAWEAANLYLVRGEKDKALREFQVAIAGDPTLAVAALPVCWRIEPDVDALLREVIPVRSDAYLVLLSLLETKEDTAGTKKVWNALMQAHLSFERRYADSYFQYLIDHQDVDGAVLVWQETANRFGLSSYLPSPGNLIVNGTFNLDVLNAGFDWHYWKQSAVNLTLDPSNFYAGRRSLQITLDGPGINDAGIYQLVAVQPNTTYAFSAYYKNGETEGAGGPHFTIQDMYNQTIYYESDELRDAGFWKSADGEFTTGLDCKLVILKIRRLPAGSPIRGKLWIDDFHLTRKP